jgi:hypothetical protein
MVPPTTLARPVNAPRFAQFCCCLGFVLTLCIASWASRIGAVRAAMSALSTAKDKVQCCCAFDAQQLLLTCSVAGVANAGCDRCICGPSKKPAWRSLVVLLILTRSRRHGRRLRPPPRGRLRQAEHGRLGHRDRGWSSSHVSPWSLPCSLTLLLACCSQHARKEFSSLLGKDITAAFGGES